MINYKFFIKLLISSLAFYLIFSKISIDEFVKSAESISVFSICLLLSLAILKFVVETFRWKFILKSIHKIFPYGYLFSLYLIAGFFSIFLPSTIGGDIARGVYLKSRQITISKAANTILFERFTGLYAVFMMCLLAVIVGWNDISEYFKFFILYYSSISIIIMTMLYVFFQKIVNLFSYWEQKHSSKILNKVNKIIQSLDFSAYKKKTIIYSMLFSLLTQAVVILTTALVGFSMGLDKIELITYFIIMPPVWVITMIPVSINGLGIREGIFALFLSSYGIRIEQSTMLSLLSFLPFAIVSLLGGVIFMFGSFSLDKIKKYKLPEKEVAS